MHRLPSSLLASLLLVAGLGLFSGCDDEARNAPNVVRTGGAGGRGGGGAIGTGGTAGVDMAVVVEDGGAAGAGGEGGAGGAGGEGGEGGEGGAGGEGPGGAGGEGPGGAGGAPGPAVEECPSPGARRCNGDFLEVCADDKSAWQKQPCAFGCNAAATPAACFAECDPRKPAAVCQTGVLLGCSPAGAITRMPCQHGCNDGDPICAICPRNTRLRCDGSTLVSCDGSGTKTTTMNCGDPGCDDAKLECRTCVAGAIRCSASNAVEQCGSDMTWKVIEGCPFGCDAGRCIPCALGTKRCEGTAIQTCERTGWVNSEACMHGCGAGTTCRTCTPGARMCTGMKLMECRAAGDGWSETTCQFGCANAQACAVCTPHARRCNGDSAEVCSADGSAWMRSACNGAGCHPQRLACNVCRPSSRSCASNTPRTCNADGSGYVMGTPCAAPENGSVRCEGEGECRVSCRNNFHPCRSAEGSAGNARLVLKCFSNFDSIFTCGPNTCNPCPGWANKCSTALCQETEGGRTCNPSNGQGIVEIGPDGNPVSGSHDDCKKSLSEGNGNSQCTALGCPQGTTDCFNDPARMDATQPFERHFFCCDKDGKCTEKQ